MRAYPIVLYAWLLPLLCSCAATYAPPTSGERATIRFTTTDGTINNPVLIHNESCSATDARMVGRLRSKTLGETYIESVQTTVPANQKISVSMAAGDFQAEKMLFRSCRRIVEFYPKPNDFYEVSFVHDNGKCIYIVDRLDKDILGKDFREAVPYTVRPNCFVR